MNIEPLLFGWSEHTWDVLDKIGILWSDTMALVTIAGSLYAAIKRRQILQWFRRNRFPSVGGALSSNERYDGIVFTVSKPDTPCWVIESVRPRFVGLIHTEASGDAARAIQDCAARVGAQVLAQQIADPDDPFDSRQAAAYLLSRMKRDGCGSLGVDITGGKVPMSLGAFMAAEEQGATSLYVTCAFDPQLRRPDMTTARLTRVSQPAI